MRRQCRPTILTCTTGKDALIAIPARSSSDRASHAVHTIPLISALALALIFSGCSEEIVPSSSPGATWSSDGAGTSHDPAEVQRQIQTAIPAAAGMPWSEYEAILERHGEIPNFRKLTNQPLSVVLGGFNEGPDVDVKELDAEFFVFNLTPRPDDVIASISASGEQGFSLDHPARPDRRGHLPGDGRRRPRPG